MKAVKFYGKFNDLYGWGKGFFSKEIARKWAEFWAYEFPKMHTVFWRYSPSEMVGACGNLVSTSETIYLHPMDFRGVFINGSGKMGRCIGNTSYYSVYSSLLNELNEICTRCAEYCGGSFTLTTTKEIDINIGDEDYKWVDDEKYLKECGEMR